MPGPALELATGGRVVLLEKDVAILSHGKLAALRREDVALPARLAERPVSAEEVALCRRRSRPSVVFAPAVRASGCTWRSPPTGTCPPVPVCSRLPAR
ncbi:hypothetical protein [Umezawaea beigongshangensis]|uniref:hypothetical protein n=1 Tax=Umezawaea beigongshangensis TaxID=2780383 RepID=UPI0018F117A1|nr:hypothetical protein [Umezawaea beigongshangensis]